MKKSVFHGDSCGFMVWQINNTHVHSAVKRLMREAAELSTPTSDYFAAPLEVMLASGSCGTQVRIWILFSEGSDTVLDILI